jgi:signal transduction histidine kinase
VKIRTRLSLWYATIMFVSLLAMGGLTYRQFAPEPRSHPPVSIADQKEDAADEGDFRETLRILLWCGVPAAVLALVGGWLLMRRALSPVVALTAAAGEINENNLRCKLPRSGNGDELDRLTEVFNAMTARLEGSFQRVREFTLHASHELKTPLAILHGELETELRDEKLSPPQRERLASQLDEVQRLSKIVDGLTLLTKADAGQIQLGHEPVRLDDVMHDAFADAQILAEPCGVKVELSACEELTVRGDRHRLRQLVLNLADNAIKYNVPHGDVKLALRCVGGDAEFTITNTGSGIPPELLPKVFDRFFRGDTSHNNTVDGCGLGLSIAQWIVSAHRGSIQIASEPAKSTIVTVRLPLAAAT